MIWQLLVCSGSIATNTMLDVTTLFIMITITVTYRAKWRLKDNPKYCWTECGKLFNINNNREIKKTVKGLIPGYWIGKDFVSLEALRSQLELIPKEPALPF